MMISVVMPLYNAAKHLSAAVDSILAQTYTEWELITVCEPHSTDDTNELVKQYGSKDNRIKPIFSKTPLGISASLNIGIESARGEYIARMDGDDISFPERLEKQIDFLQNHREVFAVGSNFQYINNRGKPGAYISRLPIEHKQIKSDLLFFCVLNHPTVMMRKADIVKHSLYYDECFAASEDFELWNRASRVVRLANMPDVLLYYRWGLRTSTHSTAGVGDAHYAAVIDRSCRELGLDFTQAEILLMYPRSCNMRFSNAKHFKHTLERAAESIARANYNIGLFDNNALASTMQKRLYWKQYSLRNFSAQMIRSILGSSYKINSAVRYFEFNGIKAAFERIIDSI